MTSETRKYESPKRREQADATRRQIAASARRLFAEHGYGATTIESIARDAGVAVQTFYAIYGSKRAVLSALLDQIDAEADLAGLMEALEQTTGDPRRQLGHVVDFNVRLFSRAADVLEVIRAAGSADADLASMSREGDQRRRDGQARIINGWAQACGFKPGLEESEAADILWSLTAPENYRLFVTECGWSPARYRDWLAGTLEWLLFAED